MAIAGFILGILGIIFGFIGVGIIPSVLGIIFSGKALRKSKSGKAIAGLVCSVLGTFISSMVILIIVLAISTPTTTTQTANTPADTSTVIVSNPSTSEIYNNVISETRSESNTSEQSRSVADLIEVRLEPTKEPNVMCAFITNNSNRIIGDAEFKFLFKDQKGNTIDFDKDGHDAILPGTTVISRVETPNDYYSCKIEKEIKPNAHPTYKNHLQNIDIKTYEGDDNLIIEITNNDVDEVEEIEYAIVYYLGDEIVKVDYPTDVYQVGSGITVTEKEYLPDKFFDRYEVYINQAHTFGL